jgi:hypothetical protein
MSHLQGKAWSASAALHVAAAALTAILHIEQPEVDFISVQNAPPPPEIELYVDLAAQQTPPLEEVLRHAPVEVAEVFVHPPDDLLHEPVEDIDAEQIRDLVLRSIEQAKEVPPEEQVDALEWLLEVDETVVSDESATEITGLVKDAFAVGDREYEPGTPAKISEMDYNSVVPYYRITQRPSDVIQIIDLNPDGDYRIVEQKDLYELYDAEMDAYRKYLESAPDNLDAFLAAKMKRQVEDLQYTAATTQHFRTIKKPEGQYFQSLNVDGAGRYRIMAEKPVGEMTLLERLRLKAFQLTENPKHKQYREAALGAAAGTDE